MFNTCAAFSSLFFCRRNAFCFSFGVWYSIAPCSRSLLHHCTHFMVSHLSCPAVFHVPSCCQSSDTYWTGRAILSGGERRKGTGLPPVRVGEQKGDPRCKQSVTAAVLQDQPRRRPRWRRRKAARALPTGAAFWIDGIWRGARATWRERCRSGRRNWSRPSAKRALSSRCGERPKSAVHPRHRKLSVLQERHRTELRKQAA